MCDSIGHSARTSGRRTINVPRAGPPAFGPIRFRRNPQLYSEYGVFRLEQYAPLPPPPTILGSVLRYQTKSTLPRPNLQSAVRRGGGVPLMSSFTTEKEHLNPQAHREARSAELLGFHRWVPCLGTVFRFFFRKGVGGHRNRTGIPIFGIQLRAAPSGLRYAYTPYVMNPVGPFTRITYQCGTILTTYVLAAMIYGPTHLSLSDKSLSAVPGAPRRPF